MKITFTKMVANEDGNRETVVATSWDEIIDMFPDIYEELTELNNFDIKEIKTYPEEFQDLLTETFHDTRVRAFRNNPAFQFNGHVLGRSAYNVRNVELEDAWLITDQVL